MTLAEILAADEAITLSQARRWLGEPLPKPERVLHVYNLQVPVFVGPKLLRADDGMVMHAAMVGEMRRSLGVSPSQWVLTTAAIADTTGLEPDALWKSRQGQIAVEFDAGRYPRERVAKKLHHYSRRYAGQVWGVLSPQRVGYVHQLARELGIRRPPTITVEP